MLFDRFGRLVFRIAERILRDYGEAEDVMQTVFLDAFQFARKFDASRGTAKAWLLQYAYHRSIRRKRQLESRNFYNAEQLESVIDAIVTNLPRRLSLSPQESARWISQALENIPGAQRATIEMTYFEGLTAEEIAGRTSQSADAVRHHLYRGLAKMRSFLEPNVTPPQRVNGATSERIAGVLAHVRARTF